MDDDASYVEHTIHQLVRAREAARGVQDWATADALRTELRSRHVDLNDRGKQATRCGSNSRL